MAKKHPIACKHSTRPNPDVVQLRFAIFGPIACMELADVTCCAAGERSHRNRLHCRAIPYRQIFPCEPHASRCARYRFSGRCISMAREFPFSWFSFHLVHMTCEYQVSTAGMARTHMLANLITRHTFQRLFRPRIRGFLCDKHH